MRVVRELEELDSSEVASVVITGDGAGEFRRLKTLAAEFGSDEVLWFPTRPERYLGRAVGISVPGLEALRILEMYKSNYSQYEFLFLVDGEHISGEPANELEEKLDEECPQGVLEVSHLHSGAYRCRGNIGAQEITVRTAIVGNNHGFIEDCIAELLELVWGSAIPASNKESFKNEVNSAVSGSNFQSLVDDADYSQITAAFPSISAALEDIA